MAITDTRPTTESPVVQTEPVIGLPGLDHGGLAGYLGTGDHKAIGRTYLVAALFFGFGALVLDTLVSAHQAHNFLPTAHVFQLYTLSRLGAVLLFAIPMFLGLATYLCPLQVGANAVAFPRLAAAALWGWLLGALLLCAAYAIDGGPNGGHVHPVDLSYAAIALIVVSLIAATTCVVTTILASRTPGLWLDRVPFFAWSMLVAGSIWLLTLPALLANSLLIYVDHHYGKPALFGLGVNQWQGLSWLFYQPAIYAIAIPALGIVTDVVTTLGGARPRHRSTLLAAIGGFGILAFGAWAQPLWYRDVQSQAWFVGVSVLIIIPVAILAGGWAVTLREGRPLLKSGLLAGVGAGVLAIVAVIAGAVYAVKPFKLHDAAWSRLGFGPPFADGQFLLVVAVATLGAIAALCYWAPKLFGRFANEGLAKLAALVGVVGGLVAGLPLMIYGFALKFHGLADSNKFFQGTSALGAALLVVAVTLVAIALLTGKGEVAADAWERGQSLEWATASPPPPVAFGVLVPVSSPEPVLDEVAASNRPELEAGDSEEAS